MNASARDVPTTVGKKKVQTNLRLLRGHTGAVTALHCVTKREVWDLVGDRDDAGFFMSGSTDCTVRFYLAIKFRDNYHYMTKWWSEATLPISFFYILFLL